MPQERLRELSHEDIQKVMSTIDIPACPAVLTLAMKESQKDDPDLVRLADILTDDAGMSAAALKFANSPLFGSGNRVSSVRKAVERLGTQNTVCVVVALALRNSINGLPAAWIEQFWKKTSLLAQLAGMIAKRQFGISPDAAYTYALFHDAAIPLMMRRFKKYGEIIAKNTLSGSALFELEEQYFPCTHPIVGWLLVRNWGLPNTLGLAIRFHHDPDVYELSEDVLPTGALPLIAVTQVAEHLLNEFIDGTDGGNNMIARAADFLGLSSDDLDDLRNRVAVAVDDAGF